MAEEKELPHWEDLCILANSVPFRTLYKYFGLMYVRDFGNTQCSCPFHGEDKHPSARIYESSNSFFCFACGFAKSVIRFSKDHAVWSTKETVLTLLTDLGNTIPANVLAEFGNPDIRNLTIEDIEKAYFKYQAERIPVNFVNFFTGFTGATPMDPAKAITRANTVLDQNEVPDSEIVKVKRENNQTVEQIRIWFRPLWHQLYDEPDFLSWYQAYHQLLNTEPEQLSSLWSFLRERLKTRQTVSAV